MKTLKKGSLIIMATVITAFITHTGNATVIKNLSDKNPIVLNKPVYKDTLESAFRLTGKKINDNRKAIAFSDSSHKKLRSHKAYYTTGTYKELKMQNIVQKEGSWLGIGGVETIKPDLKKTNFTEIDTRKATGIVISGKNAKILSQHPAGSYKLKKEGDGIAYLTIKDPAKFWSNSKYLVVEVK